MTSQFDDLARMYEDSFQLPWRSELEAHSIFSLLGDLEGKQVLDIGCGTGVYSRALARRGAGQVVGYDTSAGMIAHAAGQEERLRQGIRYAAEPPPGDAGTFDLALAVYVLPYAADYPALKALCEIAVQALKPGGRFVALPIHPHLAEDPDYYAPYHMWLASPEPRTDGCPVELRVRFDSYDATIIAHYWSRPTLERALHQSGFTDVTWHDHHVSPRGLAEHDQSYWEPYLARPHAALLHARRG